jgi:uncharacterized protein YbaR (Trm112 family)
MRLDTFEVLRCPYCGGRLELVTSSFHRLQDDSDIQDGIIACHCCVFPVIDGIPVMHLNEPAPAANDQIEAGRPTWPAARCSILRASMRRASMPSPPVRRDLPRCAGRARPAYESGYFLYRFSDPGYVVAQP